MGVNRPPLTRCGSRSREPRGGLSRCFSGGSGATRASAHLPSGRTWGSSALGVWLLLWPGSVVPLSCTSQDPARLSGVGWDPRWVGPQALIFPLKGDETIPILGTFFTINPIRFCNLKSLGVWLWAGLADESGVNHQNG